MRWDIAIGVAVGIIASVAAARPVPPHSGGAIGGPVPASAPSLTPVSRLTYPSQGGCAGNAADQARSTSVRSAARTAAG